MYYTFEICIKKKKVDFLEPEHKTTSLKLDIFVDLTWPGSEGCQSSNIRSNNLWAPIIYREINRPYFI